MLRLRLLFAAGVLALFAAVFAACGTDAMGTDTCRKIEQARCRRGPSCPEIGVQAGAGVEECVQFARDRCLHGLAVADPGPAAADKCVAAIDATMTCAEVASPETLPACAFLQPAPVPDAGLDTTDATDEGTEAASDAPAGQAEGG
jgi:hypothetical protein